jgi:hypothetical protein
VAAGSTAITVVAPMPSPLVAQPQVAPYYSWAGTVNFGAATNRPEVQDALWRAEQEAARQRAEGDRLRALMHCQEEVASRAASKRQEWDAGRSTRMLQAIGFQLTTGAFYGGIHGAMGGLAAFGFAGGLGGALAGGLVGGVLGATDAVILVSRYPRLPKQQRGTSVLSNHWWRMVWQPVSESMDRRRRTLPGFAAILFLALCFAIPAGVASYALFNVDLPQDVRIVRAISRGAISAIYAAAALYSYFKYLSRR